MINWNKLLQDLMTDDWELPRGFDRFVDGIETAMANLITNISDAFNKLAKMLEGKIEGWRMR